MRKGKCAGAGSRDCGAHTAKSGDLSRCGATWEMRQTKRCTVSCAIRVNCLMRKRGFTIIAIGISILKMDSISHQILLD
ncbi:hypothetical protein QT13_21050 [Pectobacterium brasiliense]|nr:hypothetical protein QT13_21050 [Pectobacterium brasiliense]